MPEHGSYQHDQPRRPYVDISFRLMVAAGSLRRELVSRLNNCQDSKLESSIVVTDDYDLVSDKHGAKLQVFLTPEVVDVVGPNPSLRRWNGFAVEYRLVAPWKLISNEVFPERAVVFRWNETDARYTLLGENDLHPLVGKTMLMGTDHLVYNGRILALVFPSKMNVLRFHPRPVVGFVDKPHYRYLLR